MYILQMRPRTVDERAGEREPLEVEEATVIFGHRAFVWIVAVLIAGLFLGCGYDESLPTIEIDTHKPTFVFFITRP